MKLLCLIIPSLIVAEAGTIGLQKRAVSTLNNPQNSTNPIQQITPVNTSEKTGSCGKPVNFNDNNQALVGVSSTVFGAGASALNQLCDNLCVAIQGPAKSLVAKVVTECKTCNTTNIELSEAAARSIGGNNNGTFNGRFIFIPCGNGGNNGTKQQTTKEIIQVITNINIAVNINVNVQAFSFARAFATGKATPPPPGNPIPGVGGVTINAGSNVNVNVNNQSGGAGNGGAGTGGAGNGGAGTGGAGNGGAGTGGAGNGGAGTGGAGTGGVGDADPEDDCPCARRPKNPVARGGVNANADSRVRVISAGLLNRARNGTNGTNGTDTRKPRNPRTPLPRGNPSDTNINADANANVDVDGNGNQDIDADANAGVNVSGNLQNGFDANVNAGAQVRTK